MGRLKLISIEKRLPPLNTDVLIRNEHLVYAVCFRIGESTWVESTSPRDEIVDYRVTHWVSLRNLLKKLGGVAL